MRMNPYIVGAFLPILLSLIFQKTKSRKKRGLPVDVGGEPGYALRNYRFDAPVESLWEGVTTISELFEQSCKKFPNKPLFGTRKFISKESEKSHDGRSFEKFHLGDYEWLSYVQAFDTICNFASGLIQLGHKKEERVAIFADTRAQWQIALQVLYDKAQHSLELNILEEKSNLQLWNILLHNTFIFDMPKKSWFKSIINYFFIRFK